MLEQVMHKAQMMKLQGMRIRDIAEALGKSERTIHNYLAEPPASVATGTAFRLSLSVRRLYISSIRLQMKTTSFLAQSLFDQLFGLAEVAS